MSKFKDFIRKTSPRFLLIVIYLVTIKVEKVEALPEPSNKNVTIELGPDANLTIFVGSN